MNGTALATIQKEELDTIQRAARLLAVSNYFDGKGDNLQAIAMMAAKIMAGREMGFGPFASANGIHIISGKPAVGANLMAAAVRANPRYDYRVKELTDTVCELEFFDNGKPAGNSRFTIEDATTAELNTGKNGATWKKYARNMLFARAMSNGVRWFAPDIFSGNAVYVPEELGVEVDGDGAIIEVTGRRVEPTTGEIVGTLTSHDAPDAPPAQNVNNGVPFDKDAHGEDIDGLLKEFNRLGLDLYGEQWGQVCRRNVHRISGGKAQFVDELPAEQLQKLVTGLWTLQEQRAAQAKEAA